MTVALPLALATSALAAAPPDASAPVKNTIQLQLQITGLANAGCVLKIAPGHAGCKFKTYEARILDNGGRDGMIRLDTIKLDVESSAADRDCSFAITITEPGQPPRTYHRGLRLESQTNRSTIPLQKVNLYLTSPSLASRGEPSRKH